ncbi:hypothetical protein DY000_02015782 [Brassica cretica]|uniref:Pentatricopeptide repeat-containing protein n=1 Tax=Brassica cretica TaxID=69181 RepID=A0ABQ7CU50_BRACR|nr:hypothetical protein DY000_02015782 [Brassica cretica]
MLQSDDSKHILKLNVCYVYLHAVRSLTKQMKSSGVIPDSFVLNMIIKAYAMCLEVDEAIRVFREKGRVAQGQGLGVAMERRLDEAVEVVFDMLANSLSPDMIGGSLCSLFGGNSGPVPFPASMRRFNYGNSLHVLRIIVKLVLVLNFVEL